jgi:urease accessory protein UreE
MVVGKLVEGSIEKSTINNITVTKISATYEQISVEADDLLDVLYKELNFNGEFDIYTVTGIYAAHMEKELNGKDPEAPKGNPFPPEVEAELAEAARKVELPAVRINGIAINTSLSATHQRYINNVRINKDELSKAISRASCYHNADDYKLFLKSISRMSIKYHDIIANGLPVKIHTTITREEYSDPVPSAVAPVLKLCIDTQNKHFKLQVDKDRTVRVNLSKLIKKVDTLNRKTNGRSYYTEIPGSLYKRTIPRGCLWCAEELVSVLIDCCTFEKVQKREDGIEEVVSEILISREDIVKLLDVANEQKRQIIERSKEFLATAVKLTGATIIEFLGKRAYLVKGSLREYAVVIENAKVYDYATKQYRCIVNDRHYAGAGYDDIAARLLALKNDSTMQQHIGTLRGAAQPAAENIHNDYAPERDNKERLDELVAKAYNNKVEVVG